MTAVREKYLKSLGFNIFKSIPKKEFDKLMTARNDLIHDCGFYDEHSRKKYRLHISAGDGTIIYFTADAIREMTDYVVLLINSVTRKVFEYYNIEEPPKITDHDI